MATKLTYVKNRREFKVKLNTPENAYKYALLLHKAGYTGIRFHNPCGRVLPLKLKK